MSSIGPLFRDLVEGEIGLWWYSHVREDWESLAEKYGLPGNLDKPVALDPHIYLDVDGIVHIEAQIPTPESE